jgi:hypothetical protein
MNQDKVTPIGVGVAKAPPDKPEPGSHGLQQSAKGAKSAVQTEFEKLKGAAREQGSEAVEDIKTAAESAAREAQQVGRDFMHEQKENLAQKVRNYAEAVRAASKRLREEEGNILAEPAQRAAEQLERVSSYLHEKEAADFFNDLEAFTRRRPEVVYGGLFVIGLAAARFFKASRKAPSSAGSPQFSSRDSGAPDFAQSSESLPAPASVPPAVASVPSASPTSRTL